ncbi:hypothetical protein TYRP_022008 [Tyrophagus putrescentiae]|nr:hypothetical protein TYRP_022008 [Tyrophagus putrescentiae]
MEVPFSIRCISFNCTIANCDLKFECKADLKKHQQEAHKINSKPCFFKRCKHSFVCKSNLVQHIRTVHNNARWFCSKCENFELRDYRSLRKHFYYHHERGRFGCGISGCKYVGLNRLAVYKHYRLVHQVPETTEDEEAVENHCVNDNTSSNHKFICTWPECKYRSVQRSNMMKHVRRVHLKLPISLQMQMKQNIVDDRQATDYFIKV